MEYKNNNNNNNNNNEPPRFGLETRKRNKDVNTRKQKELLKVEKLKRFELQKQQEIQKLKDQNEKYKQALIRAQNPTPANNSNNSNNSNNLPKNTRPILVFGEDKDKKSLFPEPHDIDDAEEPPAETSFSVKLGSNGVFYHEVRFSSANARENSDIQKAIELSLKQKDVVIVKNPFDEIENDFVVFNEKDESEEKEKELEHWELMDDNCNSAAMVNYVTTPYAISEVEFPSLSNVSTASCRIQINKKNLSSDNPWLNSKNLLASIEASK